MTTETEAERLKAAQRALGYSDREMAEAVGMRGRGAKDDFRKMCAGARNVTGPVLTAAELLAASRDLLRHSGIADAWPEDIDREDHLRESRVRAFFHEWQGAEVRTCTECGRAVPFTQPCPECQPGMVQ